MKVTVIKTKHNQLKSILIRYLKDIVNDLKKFNTRKIQLTIAINFIYSKGNE